MDYFKSYGIEIGQGKYHEETIYGIVLVYTSIFNGIASYLDQYGLTPAKFNVLMTIKHQGQEKGISQIDIGNRLMVTASNMTRLLEKLGRQGLIVRSSLIGDKRVKVIKITLKGSKLLDSVWPGYDGTVRKLAGHLSKEEQKMIARITQKWFYSLCKQ
jgi:MarR family transcriptional regulator, 2-MHQ and catechol-resistance regulon repressor